MSNLDHWKFIQFRWKSLLEMTIITTRSFWGQLSQTAKFQSIRFSFSPLFLCMTKPLNCGPDRNVMRERMSRDELSQRFHVQLIDAQFSLDPIFPSLMQIFVAITMRTSCSKARWWIPFNYRRPYMDKRCERSSQPVLKRDCEDEWILMRAWHANYYEPPSNRRSGASC